MKKFALPLLALCLFGAPLLAEQDNTVLDAAAPDNVVEEIVARVNNSIVTRADLRRNQEQTALDAKEQNLTRTQIEERQQNALRDLIDQQLLIQKAAELGISADADLVKRLDELRKEMKTSSMEELQKLAESQGVSWEDFKQNTKNGILTQKVIGSEVGSHIQITHEEVQKFYDEHKAELNRPERVRLGEILIANDPKSPRGSAMEPSAELVAAAQAKAGEIYERLKAGGKFDEIARNESNGSTAAQGGDLGYFKRNDLARELENSTFALKQGEFTQPIRTRQGFVILQVLDHIDAGTPPFDSVREQIQDQLYGQRVQPALRAYLTKLREEAYIDVKPGYTDAGASPNQTKLVYASDAGPKTKEVRGKLGVGKKRTVVITGREKSDHSEPAGSTTGIGLAKSESEARLKAAQERKAADEAAAVKAAAKAAENEKLSHMSRKERAQYLADKKNQERAEERKKRQEERKEKALAEKQAQSQAEEARASKAAKSGKKPKPAAQAESKQQAESSQPADSSQPAKKKKISWF